MRAEKLESEENKDKTSVYLSIKAVALHIEGDRGLKIRIKCGLKFLVQHSFALE